MNESQNQEITQGWERKVAARQTPLSEPEMLLWIGSDFPGLPPADAFELIKTISVTTFDRMKRRLYFGSTDVELLLCLLSSSAQTISRDEALHRFPKIDVATIQADSRFFVWGNRIAAAESDVLYRSIGEWHIKLRPLPGLLARQSSIRVIDLAEFLASQLQSLEIGDATLRGVHRLASEVLRDSYGARLPSSINVSWLALILINQSDGILSVAGKSRLAWSRPSGTLSTRGDFKWLECLSRQIGCPHIGQELFHKLKTKYQDMTEECFADLVSSNADFGCDVIQDDISALGWIIVPRVSSGPKICSPAIESLLSASPQQFENKRTNALNWLTQFRKKKSETSSLADDLESENSTQLAETERIELCSQIASFQKRIELQENQHRQEIANLERKQTDANKRFESTLSDSQRQIQSLEAALAEQRTQVSTPVEAAFVAANKATSQLAEVERTNRLLLKSEEQRGDLEKTSSEKIKKLKLIYARNRKHIKALKLELDCAIAKVTASKDSLLELKISARKESERLNEIIGELKKNLDRDAAIIIKNDKLLNNQKQLLQQLECETQLLTSRITELNRELFEAKPVKSELPPSAVEFAAISKLNDEKQKAMDHLKGQVTELEGRLASTTQMLFAAETQTETINSLHDAGNRDKAIIVQNNLKIAAQYSTIDSLEKERDVLASNNAALTIKLQSVAERTTPISKIDMERAELHALWEEQKARIISLELHVNQLRLTLEEERSITQDKSQIIFALGQQLKDRDERLGHIALTNRESTGSPLFDSNEGPGNGIQAICDPSGSLSDSSEVCQLNTDENYLGFNPPEPNEQYFRRCFPLLSETGVLELAKSPQLENWPNSAVFLARQIAKRLYELPVSVPMKLVFPLLSLIGDEEIDLGSVKTRLSNCLSRQKIYKWFQLLNLSIGDVQKIKFAGAKTVKELLSLAICKSIDCSRNEVARTYLENIGSLPDNSTSNPEITKNVELALCLHRLFPKLDNTARLTICEQFGNVVLANCIVNEPLCELISRLIIELPPQHRLFEVFPVLNKFEEDVIARESMSVRLSNIFYRSKIVLWKDVLDFRLGELVQFQGLGQTSLANLISIAVESTLELATDQTGAVGNIEQQAEENEDSSSKESEQVTTPFSLLRFLSEGTRWAVTEGNVTDTTDLLRALLTNDLPPDLASMRDEALQTNPTEQSSCDLFLTLNDCLANVLGSLDDRSREIFMGRIAIRERMTLEEMGAKHNVTRERIRQIESRCADKIDAKLKTHEFRRFAWRLHSTKAKLGIGFLWDSKECQSTLAELTSGFEDSGNALMILLRLAGPYEIYPDGWLRRSGIPELSDFDGVVGHNGCINRELLHSKLIESGLSPASIGNWIDHQKGIRLIEGQLYVWPKTIPDKLAVLLTIAGRPMTSEELSEKLDQDLSERSVRNTLTGNDRFIRTDLRHFGLASWGIEEFSGISIEIQERIQMNGGSISIFEIEQDLVETFGLKSSSVKATIATPMFVVEKGQVRLRRESEEYSFPDQFHDVKCAYLVDENRLNWRIPIYHDHLRGSGFSLPKGIASWLDLKPGSSVHLNWKLGTVSCSWSMSSTAGPNFGSIRLLLESIDAKQGQEALIKIDRESKMLEVAVVVAAKPNDFKDRLSQLTGIPLNGCDWERIVEWLCYAVKCDKHMLERKLAARGETGFLELIPKDVLENSKAEIARKADRRGDDIDDLMNWIE